MASLEARPPGAAQRAEAAPSGPGPENMTRTGWITIAVPAELYEGMKRLVPARAKSVGAYAQFWLRLGVLIDNAMTRIGPGESVTQRVIDVLQAMEGADAEKRD